MAAQILHLLPTSPCPYRLFYSLSHDKPCHLSFPLQLAFFSFSLFCRFRSTVSLIITISAIPFPCMPRLHVSSYYTKPYPTTGHLHARHLASFRLPAGAAPSTWVQDIHHPSPYNCRKLHTREEEPMLAPT